MYIVDSYCKELQLAIEVDGSSHYYYRAQIKDKIRQKRLEGLGVKFSRFNDDTVTGEIGVVVYVIKQWIVKNIK